jgi:hypothetical protein
LKQGGLSIEIASASAGVTPARRQEKRAEKRCQQLALSTDFQRPLDF